MHEATLPFSANLMFGNGQDKCHKIVRANHMSSFSANFIFGNGVNVTKLVSANFIRRNRQE